MGPFYNRTGECPAEVDWNLYNSKLDNILDINLFQVKNGKTWLCNVVEKQTADLLKGYLEHIKSNNAKYPREKVIALIAGYKRKIKGMEPLLVRAVRLGRLEITKVLFETLHDYSLDACREVFSLEKCGTRKFKIIHQAIVLRNFELVKYLANKYIEIEAEKAKDPSSFSGWSNFKDLIVKKDKNDFALLDLALTMCRSGCSDSLKILQYLLQHADIFSHMESQYKSLLHTAIQYGDINSLKSMICAIREGVKTINHRHDKETIDKILNLSDAHNRTLLHYAVLKCEYGIVIYLMELGASSTCFNKNKISPLFMAISLRDLDMVRLLLNPEFASNASLQSNINHQGNAGLTPLNFAVSCIDKLHHGTSRALQYVLGEPSLFSAKTNQVIVEIVATLLRAGANPCIPDMCDEIPLFKAAGAGNDDLVMLLLDAMVNLGIPGSVYDAALHKAAEMGNPSSVLLLLKAGANPLAANVQRYTPLDIALKKILIKPPLEEYNQSDRIKMLALILDQAIIQRQLLDQAVGVKGYESDVLSLFTHINSICKHANHRYERNLLNELLDSSLLQPYGISTEITSQCKGKKRPCDDFDVNYINLNKKRSRNSDQAGDHSSGKTQAS